MWEILMYACERSDRSEWYERQHAMTLSGLSSFWFSLTALVSAELIVLWDKPDDQPRFAREAILKLLCWWPTFCSLNSRFSVGLVSGNIDGKWPFWGAQVFRFLRTLDVADSEIEHLKGIAPDAAGHRIRELLA
jgi:hypothetical protein